ncbi:Com family DNA-binding transcriptional regulator [Paramagnetospirillum magneticum]|uniref:Com family DNA-binding transcriptional regulator n=1 Tax=Paramagnetospirillum magneticum TaxID=84159 RepID=UPI0011D1338D
MESIRCGCGRLLLKAAGPLDIEVKCPRCGAVNRIQRATSPQPERRGAPREQPDDHKPPP